MIGLGRIGGNLARHALELGYRVVGSNRSGAPDDLVRQGLRWVRQPAEMVALLRKPRVVLLYVPAGAAVDGLLDQLGDALHPGDIVVDGGNSYWGDSIRRAARLREQDLLFVDLGTSGGVEGARTGACFMAGGDKRAIARVAPILQKLAVPGGYVHAGPSGAGHFAKLVHNGIEFGMLQAIGEGVDLLERYPQTLPIADILRSWRHGSVIRSWLIDLMAQRYREDGGLGPVPALVEDTGEVNWLVSDALAMETPIPVIAQSVMQLAASRDTRKNWARAIAMMRKGFGGHPYGRDPGIARERREGRVGSGTRPSRNRKRRGGQPA